MATVQLAPRNFTPTTPYSAVQASPQAGMMEGAALSEVGRALSETSRMLADFAMKKQSLVNNGILASQDTKRRELAAQIEIHVGENPSTPKEWKTFADTAWEAYKATRQEDMKEWGKDVIDRDTELEADFKSRADISLSMATSKGQIRVANARMENNAYRRLRDGDYKGFQQAFEGMNLPPDQKAAAIRRGLEEGTYKISSNQLDALQDKPPAHAIKAYKTYTDELNAKEEYTTEDGKKQTQFKEWEYGEGGMSLGARVQLQSIADARSRAAQRDMDRNAADLARGIEAGDFTMNQVNVLVEQGDLDEATATRFNPSFKLAEQEIERKQDLDAEKDMAQSISDADKRMREEEKLGKDAMVGAIGELELISAYATGKITETQRDTQIKRMKDKTDAEQAVEDGTYQVIQNSIHQSKMQKLLAFGTAKQPSEEEYRKIIASISESELTQTSKVRLLNQFFAMKVTDLEDLEEEGTTTVLDRTMTPAEKKLRIDLIEQVYKKLPETDRVRDAGIRLLADEARIRTLFDKVRNPNEAQIKTALDEIKIEAADQGASSALKDFPTP